MAGQYTRQSYDPAASAERTTRSTNPLSYRLDTNYAVNCNRCFAPYGPRSGPQGSDVVGEQVDIDSILRGVTKINSKSNKEQMPDSLNPYNLYNRPNCSEKLEPEYTRYTYPAYDIRGLTV